MVGVEGHRGMLTREGTKQSKDFEDGRGGALTGKF